MATATGGLVQRTLQRWQRPRCPTRLSNRANCGSRASAPAVARPRGCRPHRLRCRRLAAVPEQPIAPSATACSNDEARDASSPPTPPQDTPAGPIDWQRSPWSLPPWDAYDVLGSIGLLYAVNTSLAAGAQMLLASLGEVYVTAPPAEAFAGAVAAGASGVPAGEQLAQLMLKALQLGATVLLLRVRTGASQSWAPAEPWFQYRLDGRAAAHAAAAAAAALGLSSAVVAALSSVTSTVATHDVQGAISAVDPVGANWLAVFIPTVRVGVLTPITEELLFRGYVLPSLAATFSPMIGVLCAAGSFAVIHPLGQLPVQFVLGVTMGTSVLLAEGNLMVPTLAHAIYNLALLLYTQ